MRFQGSTHHLVLLTGNPAVAKKKLDEIMEDLDLTMNAEKTRIVRAEEGFDFLGFRFVRQYSQWRKKRVTRWFPSPKSEMKIRERILALTGNNALALTTPEEAKEILIPVLRGWEITFHTALYPKSSMKYGNTHRIALCTCIADSTTCQATGEAQP